MIIKIKTVLSPEGSGQKVGGIPLSLRERGQG